jgi:hypothetical protein
MPKGDYLANGMLAAAADNPADREALAPDTFAARYGEQPTQIEFAHANMAPGGQTPAGIFGNYGRGDPLDWRYDYADLSPKEKDLLFRTAHNEIDDRDIASGGHQRFLEGALNRLEAEKARARAAGAREPTMTDLLSRTGSIRIGKGETGGRKYYPGVTHARVAATSLSDDQRAYWENLYGQVTGNRAQGVAPSNICNFCTGNESGPVHSGGAEVVAREPRQYGERWVAENWTVPWVNEMRGLGPTAGAADASTSSTYPASSGSVARPGSSPTVAAGTTGDGDISSLPNASLAAALMPYFQGAAEQQKGQDYANIIAGMGTKPIKSQDTDYRSFFRPLRSTYGQFG